MWKILSDFLTNFSYIHWIVLSSLFYFFEIKSDSVSFIKIDNYRLVVFTAPIVRWKIKTTCFCERKKREQLIISGKIVHERRLYCLSFGHYALIRIVHASKGNINWIVFFPGTIDTWRHIFHFLWIQLCTHNKNLHSFLLFVCVSSRTSHRWYTYPNDQFAFRNLKCIRWKAYRIFKNEYFPPRRNSHLKNNILIINSLLYSGFYNLSIRYYEWNNF